MSRREGAGGLAISHLAIIFNLIKSLDANVTTNAGHQLGHLSRCSDALKRTGPLQEQLTGRETN